MFIFLNETKSWRIYKFVRKYNPSKELKFIAKYQPYKSLEASSILSPFCARWSGKSQEYVEKLFRPDKGYLRRRYSSPYTIKRMLKRRTEKHSWRRVYDLREYKIRNERNIHTRQIETEEIPLWLFVLYYIKENRRLSSGHKILYWNDTAIVFPLSRMKFPSERAFIGVVQKWLRYNTVGEWIFLFTYAKANICHFTVRNLATEKCQGIYSYETISIRYSIFLSIGNIYVDLIIILYWKYVHFF